MLVYGDGEAKVLPSLLIAELRRDDGRWLAHDALRDRFVALAGLAQGIADNDYQAHGVDRQRPAEQTALGALRALGEVLLRSWDEGCAGAIAPPLPPMDHLPGHVTIREGEGYAHYALYPEAYGLAARQLDLRAPPLIVGLRSIGAGLAAMASAALGAAPPVTLRPGGDPFARSLKIDPELATYLLKGKRHFVIVDEGPGLSGSSFGCVADWLEDHGVPPDRIAFLPGHSGVLGPQASARHRQRWKTAQRPVVQPDRLAGWIGELLGGIESWSDISGGGWRPLWSASEHQWPAVVPAWERMKFLVGAGGHKWLVRFAGFGQAGEDKVRLAKLLAEKGFGPEVAGLTHGWLAMRWHEDAGPTRPSPDELAAYLAVRSELPAPPGASLAALVTMARRNVPELGRWDPPVHQLQRLVRSVRTDGRLQVHEWLRLSDGRLLKADALDHHRGHDLIGAQDIAWDVAGAWVELGHDARLGDRRLVAFYQVAYCAFQIGAHELGKGMSPAEERPRLEAAVARYRSALVDAIKHLGDVEQALGRGIEAFA
nr:hypothetical protein [uncultured Sphingomonas sp.]